MAKKYYFITSVRREKNTYPEGTKNYKDVDVSGKEYYTTDTRCWGFYTSKKKAFTAVKENWTDMNECGYYPWIVIEEIEEGLIAYDREEFWFQEAFDTNMANEFIKGKTEQELKDLEVKCYTSGRFHWVEKTPDMKILHDNFIGYKEIEKPEWAEHLCGWGIG